MKDEIFKEGFLLVTRETQMEKEQERIKVKTKVCACVWIHTSSFDAGVACWCFMGTMVFHSLVLSFTLWWELSSAGEAMYDTFVTPEARRQCWRQE